MNETSVLRAAVGAAVMAPSTHNTQPWRFRITGSTLDMFADRSRQLNVIDVARRQQIQSCGCALYNARVAVRSMGYQDETTIMLVDSDLPDHIATLHLGAAREVSRDDLELMRAVGLRRTNRRAFLPRPVPPLVVDSLVAAANAEGVACVRLDPGQKLVLGSLVEQADHAQFADPAFRQELGNWLTPFGSVRNDGIPFVEKEYGSSMPFALMRALRSPGIGKKFGEIEEGLVLGAPVVFAFFTRGDDPPDWFAAGEALEAVLLRATTLDLSASFLNQVLEVPQLREQVGALVPNPGYPQMILRLGVPAEPVAHVTPRRDIDDVLERP